MEKDAASAAAAEEAAHVDVKEVEVIREVEKVVEKIVEVEKPVEVVKQVLVERRVEDSCGFLGICQPTGRLGTAPPFSWAGYGWFQSPCPHWPHSCAAQGTAHHRNAYFPNTNHRDQS